MASSADYDLTPLGLNRRSIMKFISDLFGRKADADTPLKVGIEREFFLVDRETGKPVPHLSPTGERSISRFIEEVAHVLLADVTSWGDDGSATVAEGKFGVLKTEEGHQGEYAGRPSTKLTQVASDLASFHKAATEVSERLGIRMLLMGTDPQLTTGESRQQLGYTDARFYSGYRGSPLPPDEPPGYSQVAAADQATIDIPKHAKTRAEMIRTANLIMLLIAPLADNSPQDGFPSNRRKYYRDETYMLTGPLSSFYRSTAQGHTAKHDKVLENDFLETIFKIPLEYLLRPSLDGDTNSVKPYSVPLGLTLGDVVGKNLREMEIFKTSPELFDALEGHPYLTAADVKFDLALVKPTVLLKPGNLIELRMADAGPSSDWVLALAAVAKALHDPVFYRKISDKADQLTPQDIETLYHGTVEKGARYEFKGRSVFDWAGEIVEAAATALDKSGEGQFLDCYRTAVSTRRVPADYATLAT